MAFGPLGVNNVYGYVNNGTMLNGKNETLLLKNT